MDQITVFGKAQNPGQVRTNLINHFSIDDKHNQLFIAMGSGYRDRSTYSAIILEIDQLLGDFDSKLIVMASSNDNLEIYPFFSYQNIDFIKNAYFTEQVLIIPTSNSNSLTEVSYILKDVDRQGGDIGVVVSEFIPHIIQEQITNFDINQSATLNHKINLTLLWNNIKKKNTASHWISTGNSYVSKEEDLTNFIQLNPVNTFKI